MVLYIVVVARPAPPFKGAELLARVQLTTVVDPPPVVARPPPL